MGVPTSALKSGGTIHRVSLLSLIRESGPVRDWFAANFPETRSFAKAANRELRGGSEKEPCAVAPVPGADAGLVGTAVGYALAAHLREDALEGTVAANGARLLDRSVPNLEPSPTAIERWAVARVRELRPSKHDLDREEWSELARFCLLLARFEQTYRVGLPGVRYLLPLLVEHGHALDALTRAVATEPTQADLEALARATVEDHVHLRDSEALHLGPTFAQSVALGGADADVIADGILIELKSARGQIVGRTEVWQLLGYLFADTDDRYGIKDCSVFALRRRRSSTWTAQELIDALVGGSAEPIEYWRKEFAALLVPVAEARERRVLELMRRRPRRE
jgi:hypothetical protein